MLKNFICPDKKTIAVNDCLKNGGCRMGKRCAALPYLSMCAEQRKPAKIPSVTQLISRDIRQSMLEYQYGYDEAPDSMAFRILGTSIHSDLDKIKHPSVMSEGMHGRMTYDDIFTGLPDSVVVHDGMVELIDYKVSGAFVVKKMLGMKKVEGVWRRGQVKPDFNGYNYQLNAYRLLIEKNTELKVDKMSLMVIVRDGGMMASRSSGITDKTYYIDVPFCNDDKLLNALKAKSELFKLAMKTGTCQPCAPQHRWDGERKCKDFCSVKKFCDYGKLL